MPTYEHIKIAEDNSIPGRGGTALDARYTKKGESSYSPLSYGAVGDGTTDDTAAFNALLTNVPLGATIDLGGRSYKILTTVSIGKSVSIQNGSVIGDTNTLFLVNSSDVTFRLLNITRSINPPATNVNLGTKSSVVVQGERFRSLDCNYTDSAHACIYVVHNRGNGSRIKGGTFKNSVAVQNGCAIYVAAGTEKNTDIVVEGITVENTGSPDGILFYDSSKCTISGNTVRNLRALPEVTLTGWTLVSGTTWKAVDRTDGKTRALIFNGTEMTETTQGAGPNPTPNLNEWGNGDTDGYIYVNTGTDPNTVTVLSRIVSGYATLFYSTTNATTPMTDNLVSDNIIEDVDGFGIYLQLDRIDAVRNGTRNNRLHRVCLRGEQSNKLPFAAIGTVGGSDLSYIGDTVSVVGTTQYPAPGFRCNPPRILADGTANTSGACKGTVIGMTVTEATKTGIYMHAGTWSYVGCRSNNNNPQGFDIFRASSSFIYDVTLTNCEAIGNTVHGVALDNTGYSGATVRGAVIGGVFRENGSRGVILIGAQDSRVIGVSSGPNGVGQAGIHVAGTSSRILLSDNSIPSGNVGVLVASTVTDVTVGPHTFASHVQTKLSLAIPVKTGGIGDAGTSEWTGPGTPEGVVTANAGSTYVRTDGTSGTTLYIKESGTGNTGWIPQFSSVAISPNGTKYRISISDTGSIIATSI